MIVDMLARMPADWKTTVIIVPRQGRDQFGDPTPDGDPYEVPGCMIGPAGLTRDNGRLEGPPNTDTTDSTLHIYLPIGSVVRARDIVMVPPSHLMSGTMAVDGDPMVWPFGIDANLRRTDGSGEIPYNWLIEYEEVLPGWVFDVQR